MWTKPGPELEMGFGDFEHLAAPLGLLGKVSGFSRRSDLSARRMPIAVESRIP
jgi:hypothetical protein